MADAYESFCTKIYKRIGLDLSQYKRPQMERRILSLMRSQGIEDLDAYFTVLESNKEHLDKFINHLTINVSEFYRNPSQWDTLRSTILPELLKRSPGGLKVWSAGCSTGEEPYTIAMVLNEIAPGANHQIIATDIDQPVMQKAQAGLYNIKAAANLPTGWLEKYFTKDGDLITIKPNLRKWIKFKYLNLLTGPFESNVDLLVCRNVVIYFTEEAKSVLYRNFHKSLKQNGMLFIGSTEQIFQPQEIGFESKAMFFYEKVRS